MLEELLACSWSNVGRNNKIEKSREDEELFKEFRRAEAGKGWCRLWKE